ncbi:MAG: hypothetical protein E4G99_11195 [Anaerolineales bacterium]|nr:MAG: hypothetical protein E4G99_11195 [Anaerolineales bacterium]
MEGRFPYFFSNFGKALTICELLKLATPAQGGGGGLDMPASVLYVKLGTVLTVPSRPIMH